jgi:nucleotide-binding universal stress UspA family protein
MLKLKNILIPIDFSENSINTFYLACSLAKPSNGLLHLLHVIKPNNNSDAVVEGKLNRLKIKNAKEELDKFINEIPHPAINITEKIRIGEPEKEILDYACENNVDLIIINSHGWTGKLNEMMGTVANNVFQYSPIPILCLKNFAANPVKDFSIFHSTAENWVG